MHVVVIHVMLCPFMRVHSFYVLLFHQQIHSFLEILYIRLSIIHIYPFIGLCKRIG